MFRGRFQCSPFPYGERRGGRLSSPMRRFADVLNDLGLRDPLQGGPYT